MNSKCCEFVTSFQLFQVLGEFKSSNRYSVKEEVGVVGRLLLAISGMMLQ